MRFPGPLLLAVFLRVLMEMTLKRSAHRVMGMIIYLELLFKNFNYLLFRMIKGYSKNAGMEEIVNT